MKKYAIYTAIVGSYDEVLQPKIVDDDFDYIIFSNSIAEEYIGIWQIREIPFSQPDNTRIARWVKTHPNQLLPEYKFSIWMDANLQILSPFLYERARSLFENGTLIASMWHHLRDCIYDEAASIMAVKLEYETTVCKWLALLKKNHYPYHNGLFETNVVFRAHNNQRVILLDEQWFCYISSFSKRDQLSFNFVLWELDIPCQYILPVGENTSNSPHFYRHIHNRGSYLTANRKLSPIMTYAAKLYAGNQLYAKLTATYNHIIHSPLPYFSMIMRGFFYRLLCFLKGRQKLKMSIHAQTPQNILHS